MPVSAENRLVCQGNQDTIYAYPKPTVTSWSAESTFHTVRDTYRMQVRAGTRALSVDIISTNLIVLCQ